MWRVLPNRLIVWLDNWRLALLDWAPAWISQIPSHRIRLSGYRLLGARIGEHTSIHRGCQFYNISGLKVSENTVINQMVILDGRSGLTIGRNVSVSEQTMIYTLHHDLDDPDFVTIGAPVVIEDYVFIGARARSSFLAYIWAKAQPLQLAPWSPQMCRHTLWWEVCPRGTFVRVHVTSDIN